MIAWLAFLGPLYFILISASVITILVITILTYKHIKSTNYLKNFTDYVSVLEYYMKKGYEITHKDKILTYSLEATRIKEKDVDNVSKSFVRLTVKLMGARLYKQFCYLYGDEDTLIFNMIEYFNSQYEEDAIRQQALDDISSSEESNDKSRSTY
jgi:hypothetical protein